MKTVIYVVITDAAERAEMEQALQDAQMQYQSFATVQAFLNADPRAECSCVVSDLGGHLQGLELRRELQSRQLHLPMLLLTHEADLVHLIEAAGNGDVALLERPITSDSVVDSITGLLEMRRRREAEQSEVQAIESRIARLTQRESEVTMKVLKGLSNKEISTELGISIRTVEKHRAAVMNKLGASNLAELCSMRPHCERIFASFLDVGRKLREPDYTQT